MYDLFAPAVYGKILSIVRTPPIADKVFEKIFIKAFKDNEMLSSSSNSPLITLLNHSREKSLKVMTALAILSSCGGVGEVNSGHKR